MNGEVAIVIPAHGNPALTRRCLETILHQPKCDETTLIVVDDGSPGDLAAGWPPNLRERVRLLRRERRGGFARACNAGAREAAAAGADLIVFLNNDTIPQRDWLRALLDAAARFHGAAALGSRLLYPDGSTQHAGIAICQDRYPRHLYAHFPGDHPAVTRSRRVRAVSAACMLVRRAAFEEMNGFDEEYENGLEDVDLCLRLGRAGYEIRYCGDSVLTHLELATRSLQSPEIKAGEKRYLAVWGDSIEPDDVDHYLSDGLLRLRYEPGYPLRLRVSPWLAAIEDDGREAEANRLLIMRSRQAFELLRESIRLTVMRAQHADQPEAPASSAGSLANQPAREQASIPQLRAYLAEAHAELRRRDEQLASLLHELQRLQAASMGERRTSSPVAPAASLAYHYARRRLRDLVTENVPAEGVVAIVTKGDDELLELGGREAWHFPRDASGEYTGVYPGTSHQAVTQLEELRASGATHLAFPATSVWWLDHYRGLRDHLERECVRVAGDRDSGLIYYLGIRDDRPGRVHVGERDVTE
jgi:GT2 family glycosyltransferase